MKHDMTIEEHIECILDMVAARVTDADALVIPLDDVLVNDVLVAHRLQLMRGDEVGHLTAFDEGHPYLIPAEQVADKPSILAVRAL